MKIIKKTPLSIPELEEFIKDVKEENKKIESIKEYIKKFAKLNFEDAKKLRQELKELNIPKLGEEQIVKIIDILPEDSDDLRKIFFGTSTLNQDEIQKILEVVKKYKK
ncbi:MAG: DNA-directed RNA polymerase subunit F [Candidatus Pacearchaeota archaeon]